MKQKDIIKEGSVQVWENLWHDNIQFWVENIDEINNTGQLFEYVKYQYLQQIFPNPNDGKIIKSLEAGCGSASVSLYFSKKGYEATMLDASREALTQANNNFNREKIKGKFVLADINDMPFEDNTYDVVMSFGVLEHFEDIDKPIKEMIRVLKPGGLMFADIVPKRFSVQSLGNWLNFISNSLVYLLKLKPSRIKSHSLGFILPPFYENKLSNKTYIDTFGKYGLKNIKMLGNRPFPYLSLGKFEKYYLCLLKKLIPAWERFDRSDSDISRLWGAGWWAYGIKGEPDALLQNKADKHP